MFATQRLWVGTLLGLLAGTLPAPAQVGFEKPLLELGEIRGGLTLHRRLEIVNADDQAVDLVEATASCGCLAPRLEKRHLRSGEKAALFLDIRPVGLADGPHAWNGLVRFRRGDHLGQTPFSVRATVCNEVSITPAVLAVFVEGAVKQEVTLSDRRSPPLKILQARCSSAAVQVVVQAQGNGVTKIHLEIKGADLPLGHHHAVLDILTDDPLYDRWRVPMTLIKAGGAAIRASPEKIELRRQSGHQEISAMVRLRSRGPIAIAKVQASEPALKCTWASDPEQGATLKVRLRSDLWPEGAERATIHVLFREPAGEQVTIPVTVE